MTRLDYFSFPHSEKRRSYYQTTPSFMLYVYIDHHNCFHPICFIYTCISLFTLFFLLILSSYDAMRAITIWYCERIMTSNYEINYMNKSITKEVLRVYAINTWSVVLTWQYYPPISKLSSPGNEYMSTVWSMFLSKSVQRKGAHKTKQFIFK